MDDRKTLVCWLALRKVTLWLCSITQWTVFLQMFDMGSIITAFPSLNGVNPRSIEWLETEAEPNFTPAGYMQSRKDVAKLSLCTIQIFKPWARPLQFWKAWVFIDWLERADRDLWDAKEKQVVTYIWQRNNIDAQKCTLTGRACHGVPL